jgi:hypothetical protein
MTEKEAMGAVTEDFQEIQPGEHVLHQLVHPVLDYIHGGVHRNLPSCLVLAT